MSVNIKPNRYWNLSLYLSVATAVLVLFSISVTHDIPFSFFTRDPLAIAGGQPYFGLLSNLGILFWCGSSILCFFTYSLLIERGEHLVRSFLLASGALTLLLLMDDLFLLHEQVLPQMLGVRQRYPLLLYLLLTLLYLWHFRKIIYRRNVHILCIALGLFSISLLSDAWSSGTSWAYLLEDGSKFLGVVSWFNYFLHICYSELMQKPTLTAT